MKKLKSKHIGLVFLISSIIFSAYIIPLMQISRWYNENDSSTTLKSSSAPSQYSIGHSVTYSVTINFSLTRTGSGVDDDYLFKWARLDDRQPNSATSPDHAPYQISYLKENSITSNGDNLVKGLGYIDKFNNTFDNITVELDVGEWIKIDQQYNVTLNEITFPGLSADLGSYPGTGELWDLYNVTEEFFECNDTDLIDLSNRLVLPSDSIVEKAQKIIDGVTNELTYDGQEAGGPGDNGEKGADWAEENNIGDCSEFSDLMITLLRIQSIPARKVIGLAITLDSTAQPTVGTTYTHSANQNGHAWIEYYVPEVGWVACDPTWDKITNNHFNRMDTFHLIINNGAWFDRLSGTGDINELGLPAISYTSDYDSDYTITLIVIASTYVPIDWVMIIIIVSIIGAIVVVSIVIIRKIARRGRNKSDW